VPSLGSIGNNTLLQIVVYNLVGQLIGAVVGPYAQAISNEVMSANPLIPLSPADLALAVVRNELSEEAAATEAAMSGYNAGRFHTLTRLTGDAPGPGDLAVALRRGLIDGATYDRGIRQGRLRDEWADLVRELAVQQPPPQAMLQAYLEGQVDEAEARAKYAALGGDPAYFDVLFHTQGQAPTPLEAAEMARRGIIGWEETGPEATSFRQAFLEGPWRNKWEAPYRALTEVLPPPRTITAMYREGALTHDQAAAILAKQGVTPDLQDAYLFAGSQQKTQGQRDLALGTITQLYQDRLVKLDDATAMIEALGYDATEAGFILALEDTKLAARFLSLAVGRIHALYVGHKLARAATISVLGQLGVDPNGVSDLVGIWDWERAANVKSLTAAEIAGAMHYKIITQAEAQADLVELGYTPHDAWLYLSVHEKAPLGEAPPADSIGPAPGA
jgi:hypothetical protein